MNDLRKHEVEELSKTLYHNYCKGELEQWFNYLHKDCVFVSPGEPMLAGAKKIKDYFIKYPAKVNLEIINESYSTITHCSSEYIVTGNALIGTDRYTPVAAVLMTFCFHYIGNTPKIIYQHMSYDYVMQELTNNQYMGTSAQNTNLIIRLIVRQAYSMKEPVPPICVKSGQQLYYIPPYNIIYLQSNRHKTIIYCTDKVLECSMLITDIFPMLPKEFCFVRRGCVVNSIYVTSIRRCEVELVFGTVIQIPVPLYTNIKKKLNELIMHKEQ